MKTTYMNWKTNKLEEGIRKNANNIMWVEYWIERHIEQYKIPAKESGTPFKMEGPAPRKLIKYDEEIAAEPYKGNKWICTINIPLVEETIEAIATTEINAMINAADKAAKLINEYLEFHPELRIRNRFKNGHWQIIGDKKGNFIEMGLSPEARKREGKKMTDMMSNSLKTIENAISKLERINGTSKNLFIQVLDKDLFKGNMSTRDILNFITDKIREEYGVLTCTVSFSKTRDHVIVVGYTTSDFEDKIGGEKEWNANLC